MASTLDDAAHSSGFDENQDVSTVQSVDCEVNDDDVKRNKVKRKRIQKEKPIPVKKERSVVWEHFTKVQHPLIEMIEGVEKAVGHTTRAHCKYCPVDIAISNSSGTSTLRKHIVQHCTGYKGRVGIGNGGQTHFATEANKKEKVVVRWSQENCILAATKMIVIDELPFSHISKPGFRLFCEVDVPDFILPSRKTIAKTFLRMYEGMKEDLKKELSKHCLSLTTDTWTSLQNINYMVLTAHFIDNDWKMNKRVLNFCVISNHKGLTIGKILENCLLDWGIKRVLTISVDNASANKVVVDYIRRKLANLDNQQVLGGRFLHVRCLAHIVNLITKSGLSIMEKSVASIRNAVRYVRSSPQRLDAFKACVENENLDCKKVCVLDVTTRWNSTYIMLDTALELRLAFDRMAEEEYLKYTSYFTEEEDEDEDEVDEMLDLVDLNMVDWERANNMKTNKRKRVGPPTEVDWERAETFVQFLQVFFYVTVRVSASKHPTSTKAFHDIVAIHAEIDEFKKKVDNDMDYTERLLCEMAVEMKSKYNKYFEDINQLLLVALVLDPRYKLKFFERVCLTMLNLSGAVVKKKCEELKELLITLTDLYASAFGTRSNGKKNDASYRPSKSIKRTGSKKTGKMAELEEDWKRSLEEGDTVVVAHEVDRYLLHGIELLRDDEEFDILLWWKVNGNKFPNLQAVAKDVLAIQVSTVASGSCFSTGKRVISPHRSSLTPRSVEALICLQNWLKSEGTEDLEYTPTTEEIEWCIQMEKEKEGEDKEARDKLKKDVAAVVLKSPKASNLNRISNVAASSQRSPKTSKLNKNSDAERAAKATTN